MNFKIDPSELLKLTEWMERVDKELVDAGKSLYEGAAGGRYTYSFTPTSLGIIVKVTDGLVNRTLDLTDYDSW